MKKIVGTLLALALSTVSFAQQAPPKPAEKTAEPQVAQATKPSSSEAKPADVNSIDAIVQALYDVISGPAGARDWNRFHSLFIPEARMTATGKRPDGTYLYRSFSPKEYEERSGAYFLKEGFFENGIHNDVEQFGQEAQVWSTYESRHEKTGQPFARGINSIQLLNDGNRWWVVSILWDSERPDNPIPEKYLK
jgi:hypothetical protein